jgi:hypothetical protein
VIFATIAAESAHYPVQVLCRTLVLLHASFTGGRGYYGSPRIHDGFTDWGERISRKRITRLKQEEGLVARVVKRYRVTTDSDSKTRFRFSYPVSVM